MLNPYVELETSSALTEVIILQNHIDLCVVGELVTIVYLSFYLFYISTHMLICNSINIYIHISTYTYPYTYIFTCNCINI